MLIITTNYNKYNCNDNDNNSNSNNCYDCLGARQHVVVLPAALHRLGDPPLAPRHRLGRGEAELAGVVRLLAAAGLLGLGAVLERARAALLRPRAPDAQRRPATYQ